MGTGTGHFLRVAAAAVIVGAMVVSAAQASPDEGGGSPDVGGATLEQSLRPDDRPGPLGVGATPPGAALSYPAAADDGFDWSGDQIGTAGALLLAALAAAGLLAIHHRERAVGG
jgi:hypothetical protein